MKPSRRRLVLFSLLAVCALGVEQVEAMPFTPDPISFASYLNSIRSWSDRSLTVRFENLGKCEYFYNGGSEAYVCYQGYAKIRDQFSSRLCRVKVWYNWKGDRSSSYEESECRDFNAREQGGALYNKVKEWIKQF